MSIALYRKYRPTKFGELTNQNHIKITIQNELETNHLAHAYLFCGPRGTGKTTMARLVAKAANCLDLQPRGEPCNQCANCLDIIDSKAMDIIEIDAASHTGVDNVRENIINNARFTPAKAKFKVFIIDEVHMLSTSAFNALLKILEEPPQHVIFILATTEVHKVPVTIISRCQRFDFKKIIISELVERLNWIAGQEHIQVDQEILALIAKNSGGCVRDAESLLEQVLSLGDKKIGLEQAKLILPPVNHDQMFALLETVENKNIKAALELINDLVEGGADIAIFTANFVEFVRQVMVYKICGNLDGLAREMEPAFIERAVKIAEPITVDRLALIIQTVLHKAALFRQTPIVQLPLEIAIIELCGQSSEFPPRYPDNPKPRIDSLNQISQNKSKPASENQPAVEPSLPAAGNDFIDNSASIISGAEKSSAAAVDIQNSAAPESVKAGNGLTITYNQVAARWPVILQCIKSQDYSLGMSLSVAKPVALAGDCLTLGFLFDLQKERVDKPRRLEVIEQVLLQEFGAKFTLKIEVQPDLKLSDITNNLDPAAGFTPPLPDSSAAQDPLGQVLDAFGGKLVDGI